MNKVILFACLFIAIHSLCYDNSATPKNVTYCKNKTLDESEKAKADVCCLYNKTDNGDGKTPDVVCAPYKKADVLKDVKANKSKYKNYSIDCASNWLSFHLFLIALIFMI